MAETQRQADTAGKDAADAPPQHALPVRLALGAYQWATASRLRMAIGGVAALATLALLFAAWSFVAHMAVDSLKPVTIDMALEALDAGRFDEARSLIGDMQQHVATPELVGGAMFVLGVLKAQEAGAESSAERRSAMSQIAAKYLAKAQAQGVPAGREAETAYLLGRCLIAGGQPQAGATALQEALRLHAQPETEIHALLIRALADSPNPDLEATLAHIEHVLRDAELPVAQREEAWLLRADTQLRLERPADAMTSLAQVAGDGPMAGKRLMILGRLQLDEALRLPAESAERATKINAAIEQFVAAHAADKEKGALAREALYWSARSHELLGARDKALDEYSRLSDHYGDTEEGLAATLAEADHARLEGDSARALAAYRAVLQAVDDPQTYDNTLLPLAELRSRLWAAYQQFVGDEQFAEALAMLELIEPVLGRVESTELRAKTHQQWGARRRDQAATESKQQGSALRQEGRFHLRAAGRSYEDLARMRFATRYFSRDLWAAADCYFQGQSFSHAARVLEEFLRHEARQWNSIALVRLGQARLARGEFDKAIAALEECIEMFPRDAGVYQARLEAARAFQLTGDAVKAEKLLRANLDDVGLTPASPEWRDSLFAMGHLLYELERYAESVDALDEAVRRYPADEATLLAKYIIARSFHNGAHDLAVKLRGPQGDEAQANRSRDLIQKQLENAHAMYEDVQQTITLAGSADDTPLSLVLIRNCYMMQGSVLLELRRFEEARQAYHNVITLYQNDPVVLESFVQVANCWRRLDQPEMARGNLERAKVVLDKLPKDVDFLASTNFSRQQWGMLLNEMCKW